MKSVDIPADFWVHSKSLFDEFVANHHIVDNIVKVGAAFVVVDPATVDEFKLFVLYEFLYLIFSLIRLFLPPGLKVPSGRLGILSTWIFRKLLNYRIER
jgi:hypothetical protein